MCIYFLSLNIYAIHVLRKIHFNLTFLAGYFNTYHMFVIEELNLQSDIPKVKTIVTENSGNTYQWKIKYIFTSNICTSCSYQQVMSQHQALWEGGSADTSVWGPEIQEEACESLMAHIALTIDVLVDFYSIFNYF